MAKMEDRPVDSGVAGAKAKSDAELTEWWKQRFALLAGVPTDIARAGALLPQLRELSRLPEADRKRLTRERIKAFVSLTSDQQQKILAARRLADAADPDLGKSDDAIADPIAKEIPEARAFLQR
jgi:hypothetical protein